MSRLALWSITKPTSATVVTATTGLRFSFDYPSQLIPLLVAFDELIEPELQFARLVGSPNDRVIDVGASIGTWTIAMAAAGARVVAFEPDPQNVKTLKTNISANGLDGAVDVRAVALGASAGVAQLSFGERSYLTQVACEQEGTAGGATTPVSTLNALSREEGWSGVDLLKVNTAGGESPVLRGASELFRDQRVKVAAVLDGIAVRTELEVIGKWGYRLGFFDASRKRFVEVSNVADLDALRPGPLNRYVLAVRGDVRV